MVCIQIFGILQQSLRVCFHCDSLDPEVTDEGALSTIDSSTEEGQMGYLGSGELLPFRLEIRVLMRNVLKLLNAIPKAPPSTVL